MVLAAVVLAATGCGGDDDDGGGSGAPPVSLTGQVNDHGTKTATAKMEVELDDFYFGPTFIKATAGQQITLELSNEGKEIHTFTMGSVDETLQPGEKKTVTITAPQSGSTTFTCKIHVATGMQGAVFVG